MPLHAIKINNCVCKRCGRGFHAKPAEICRGRKFCSVECYYPNLSISLADLFFDLARNKRPNGCILWEGKISTYGYGTLCHKAKPFLAHRVSYELCVGTIPDELYVLHKCDVRLCVNPTHLFVGTHQDNVADCIAKGRNIRGEKQWKSKITEDDVRAIRRRLREGATQSSTSRELGISLAIVSNIAQGKHWKHVEDGQRHSLLVLSGF